MRTYSEEALRFTCEGETLVGVLAQPSPAAPIGVIIIVGGPQYRAGSHRQFAQLAGAVAAAGFPALRFDYRGMGDSTGDLRTFEDVDADIRAAIDALMARCAEVRRVVLWGLCDAASAATMYAPYDPRVAGLVLLNPWVRDSQTFAKAQVKHYYAGRLLDGAFWRKLLKGEVPLLRAAGEALGAVRRSLRSEPSAPIEATAPFQQRMVEGLERFAGRTLLILSGNDLTAKEFCERVAAESRWQAVLGGERVQKAELPASDHTFSTMAWKQEVERLCVQWLHRLLEKTIGSSRATIESSED